MPSMMIALSPKTLRKLSLPWLLKPSMWVSMRLWISGGGLLVTVILLEVQRADVLGTIQAYRDWHQRAYHVDLRSKLLPYLRMLTTYLSFLRQRRVALVHGVRHSCDLGYRSVLMAMQRLRANFTYLPIVSRPQEEPVQWKGAIGHVQDLWRSDSIEHAWGCRASPDDTHVFLCGSPEMIESMIAMLVQERFHEHSAKKPGQIHSERYL